jgi:CRISPR-associated protein Cst2
MPNRAFISLILKVSGNVNADAGVGTRIPLKKIITWNQEVRPFVSARCIRRCIRERLYEKGFSIDPLQMVGRQLGVEGQLGDIGDPLKYVDDDLFGFLKPSEPPLRRSSPIKISHLISLRHAEVKVEFAARFARDFMTTYEKGYPVPFEIELAEWLGKLNVIISDRVGRFSDDELSEDLKKQLGSQRELSKDERINRLRGFLEVLLWEGWSFPRGAQSPSIPEFYYAIIGLSARYVPIFSYIDLGDDGKLNVFLLENMQKICEQLLDKLFIIDYKGGRCQAYTYVRKSEKDIEIKKEDLTLDSEIMKKIISEICNFIIQ